MSKKCRAFSESKLGLEAQDNRKAFYAGWEAAIRQVKEPAQQSCYCLNCEALSKELQHLRALVRAQQITIDKLEAQQRNDSEHSEPVAWTDENFMELYVSEDIAEDQGANIPLYTRPPKHDAADR